MIEKLQAIIKKYLQYGKRSQLYDDIVQVLSCSLSEAKDLAATHCNMVSFWAILSVYGWYEKSYANFFKWMLVKNFCNIEGFILVEKDKILKSLDKDAELIKYKEWEDVLDPSARLDDDKLYQFKIFANTRGDHFFCGYIQDGILYGCDTSFRGVPFIVKDVIKPEKFQWVMEV